MHQLPIFLTLRDRPVLFLGTGEGAEPKRRLLESAGARLVAAPEPGTRIAVLAIDDEAEAAGAAARLRAAGLLVNAVDKPALCDFSFPAIVDRSPVILAIGSGGASATLSKALRERLEALLPAALGRVADAVQSAKAAVKTRLPSPVGRRRFWDGLMRPGAPLDPLAPAENPACAIEAALEDPGARGGSITEISLGSDDPDLLTLRDLRALSQADLILVEAGVPDGVLARARRDAERRSYTDGMAIPGGTLVVIVRNGPVTDARSAAPLPAGPSS